MCKVSVIVPVYNVGDFLDKCVCSVIQQSYTDWELILVDDGSTDDSLQICERYASTDDRITVLKNNHGGVGSARNKGLDIAKGEFVAFLDSDDWLDEEFLKKAVEEVTTKELDLFMAGSIMMKNGINICTLEIPNEICCTYREIKEEQMIQMVEYNYSATCWGSLYKSNIIGQTRFDTNMKLGEDLKFVFDIFEKNPRLMAKQYVGYYYRRGHASLTSCVDSEKCCSAIKTYRTLFSVIEDKGFETNGEYCLFVQKRYEYEIMNLLGNVLRMQMPIDKKMRMLAILLSNPKSNKNRLCLRPVICLVNRKVKKIRKGR